MQKIKNQYDSLYTAEKNVFGGGKPVEAVTKLHDYLKGGTVLDLGGGEGRNALYLAEQGFSVSVHDISEVGLKNLSASAEDLGLHIDTRVCDITNEKIEGCHDSVILTFVLHHMEEEDAKKIITEAQQHTKDGGVHILSTFSNKGGLYERNTKSGRFYPDEQALRELYDGWDVMELSENETKTHARDKNGERMKNYVLSLIAVKRK